MVVADGVKGAPIASPSRHDAYMFLILKVNALYAVTDACEHFVRNSVEHIREHRYGQMVAKYLYAVALMAVDASYVNHGHIHTYIAHVGSALPVHQAVAVAVAQSAV